MKVLQIVSSYFETSLYKRLFEGLEGYGVSNIIYVPKWNDKQYETENLFIVNKKHNNIDKLLYYGQLSYITRDIIGRIDLVNIDLIHVHRLFYGGYAALKIKRMFGIPYIVAIRNSDVNDIFKHRYIFKKHALEILLEAEKVIFLSSAYKESFIDKWIPLTYRHEILEKTEVIPNGIDNYFIKNKFSRNISQKNQINLISVGDVEKNKNQLTTIKACKILIGSGYDISLTIIGRVTEKHYFDKVRTEPIVRYIPHCSKNEILQYLREADIFVMPSHYETFGLVYAEAMTQGLPVIYTKGQGFDGQFDTGYIGYAVQYNDEKEIVDAILKICNNYKEISNNCLLNTQKYNWEVIANDYKKTYHKILIKWKQFDVKDT